MSRTGRVGRHDVGSRVPEPVTGLPGDMPTSVNNTRSTLAVVAVADPFDQQRRMRALARVDLLDQERRTDRIDEAAFLMGREVERIFEGMSRISGSSQWWQSDHVDAATQAELATIMGLEKAWKVNSFLRWIVRHVGGTDARLLWLILGHRFSFATAAAALFNRRGVRGLRYARDRFADALTRLAEVKAAHGRVR